MSRMDSFINLSFEYHCTQENNFVQQLVNIRRSRVWQDACLMWHVVYVYSSLENLVWTEVVQGGNSTDSWSKQCALLLGYWREVTGKRSLCTIALP